jgi:hypothetical protein
MRQSSRYFYPARMSNQTSGGAINLHPKVFVVRLLAFLATNRPGGILAGFQSGNDVAQ